MLENVLLRREKESKLKKNEDMFTLIFAIYTLVVLTFFFLLSLVALFVCYPFDKPRRVVHELSRWLCFSWWYAPFTWRRKIEGLENVDKKKPYVIVINHNSMVDIISLYFVPLNFRWVSKQEVFRIPYIGPMLWMHGDIAIQRGRATESMRKVINDGKMWIDRGVSVAIFPEGTRSKDGSILRFHKGAFHMAQELGVDILPLMVYGTGRVLPKHAYMMSKGEIHLYIGKRLSPVEMRSYGSTLQEQAQAMRKYYKVRYSEVADKLDQNA